MKKTIKNVEINYVQYGKQDTQTLVLLHGWGQNIEMMKPLGDPLSRNYQIIILDLPGYGESSEPPFAWQISDYVTAINQLLQELKIQKPIFIGHSFGGKISLLYASLHEVEKLVLLASPYIRDSNPNKLKIRILKSLKKIPLLNHFEQVAKRHIGSQDYRQASSRMRDVLVNAVNLDLTEDVKKIACPTLIVWGTEDKAAQIERAYELETLIPNSGLIIYEGASHYAYLEHLQQTVLALDHFFSH